MYDGAIALFSEAFDMSADSTKTVTQTWERYIVPETAVSAEFPGEPWVEEGDDKEENMSSLSLDWEKEGEIVSFDLAVTLGQHLEVASSEQLADQLRAQLQDDDSFEVLSIEPRPYENCVGVLQYLRLRETGELFMQWLVTTEDDTVFAGVTFADSRAEGVAKKFLDSISLNLDGAE